MIGLYDDLHHALSLLLRTGAPALAVVDAEAGQPVGTLTLDDIRASTSERKTA
jgi:CBS domain-containing protein